MLDFPHNRNYLGDAGTLVDSYISGKVVQYKEQIATLEKREDRYKTVFGDKISVFRRACCPLFGHKTHQCFSVQRANEELAGEEGGV
ncbi:hypothetical protein RHGRI_005066 [Rhododendron griersonianum]|uniref:Uncharacterized protein n=1 Tax=Rhododendron griersonianum TaxID=479676 RepID=A0AAV6LC29_9ERIC|nr:hypothetical protein RHGRI_005066 [Rhododendron griersonianum]